MDKNRIICIGGAESQCHLIKLAQQMGLYVICVDYNGDCFGKKCADLFFQISTDNVVAICELGRKYNVSAVISTQSDLGLKTACFVSKELGLYGLSEKTVNLFTNKALMREFLSTKQYNCPKFRKCKTPQEFIGAIDEIGFPVIVKPLDSQGSRGVQKLETFENIESFYEASKYSRNEMAVIVEEYIQGKEFTVEGYMRHGKHTTLAISRKSHYEKLPCVSNELLYSWTNEVELENLVKLHDHMMGETHLEYGITHSEYICRNGEFYLVEFTARGGGAHISSKIVPAVSGIDVEKELLIDTLRLKRKKDIRPYKRQVAVLKFFELEQGKIKKIVGLDEIKKTSELLFIELNCKEGQEVLAVADDTTRHGFYILVATNLSDLKRLMKKVENTLRIEYE